MINKVERIFATLAALLVFTLHEMQLFNARPRELAEGFTHAVWIRTFGAPEHVYLSNFDVGMRWSLVALTVLLSLWALLETIARKPAAQRQRAE